MGKIKEKIVVLKQKLFKKNLNQIPKGDHFKLKSTEDTN